MGSLRFEVAAAAHGALAVLVTAVAIFAACSSSSSSTEGGSSPCKAFAIAPDPHYELEAFGGNATPTAGVSRITHSSSKAYGLASAAKVFVLGAPSIESLAIDLAAAGVPDPIDISVSKDGLSLYVLRGTSNLEVVSFASVNGGATFDPASKKSIVMIGPATSSNAGGALAIGSGGADALWIATPDAEPSSAQDDASLLGKVLRIDLKSSAPPAASEVFAKGFHRPSGIAIDGADIWVADIGGAGGGSEIDRVVKGRSYGWPVLDGNRCSSAGCVRDPHVAPAITFPGVARGVVVHRGAVSPLASMVLTALEDAQDVTAIAPYGPSGPAIATKLSLGLAATRAVGVGPNEELLVASDSGVSHVKDIAPAAPTSLRATGCMPDDLVGLSSSSSSSSTGVISYDVASPLWSDGAEKTRFVVIPAGESARVLPDGDVRFPVGTVAVKTFIVAGKKIETRLLVQHSLETWVGYSYAWNEDGADATLVSGNRTTPLSNTTGAAGAAWYFPSTTDCAACHTPAAGYTLGIESRQIASANAALDARLITPIDHAKFPPLANASASERVRGYLHSNCSMCHREGSVTGDAQLDLRIDTPLDRTGLCDPPKTGAFGIADARMIAPSAPDRSVLLHRIQSLDSDTRMPKLASHVVDDAAVAAIKEWISGLTSCP